MKICVLQPEIIRGNVPHNTAVIQSMIQRADGDLLVLAEYALTGSLVLDEGADVPLWAAQSAAAQEKLTLPQGRRLLLNRLVLHGGRHYNESILLPDGAAQRKRFPDRPELDAGIYPGLEWTLFEVTGKRFIAVICSDLRKAAQIPTERADFVLFIFHFTPQMLEPVTRQCMDFSRERGIPVIAASLCSDQNCGHSAYISGDTVVALDERPGILTITL